MDRSTKSRYNSSYTLGEWLCEKANELEIDAVSLDSVVGVPRVNFGLDDADIDEAVRECLASIMARGARPIQGHNDGDGTPGYWTHVNRFGDDPAGVVEGVIREWHEAGVDPDIGDVWFALPWFIEGEQVREAVDGPR